jgi:tRNA(fMet)-specific endonuclease VapC
VARLILDTGVLICGGAGRVDLAALADTDDVAVPAVVTTDHRARFGELPDVTARLITN